ncbi:lasso peptide biosynthesis B2 protein [Clostridium sp.]|uniref:lasso peptide biosynthesis B2 protein n=1 Tax=Clostridium sp. TaxID=1506 RepID=UPI002FC9400B
MSLLRFCKSIKTFTRLDFRKKRLFARAFILTGINRYSILNTEFKNITNKIGTSKEESSHKLDKKKYKIAREVSDVVRVVSSHTPWESLCLVQAMTAQKLLKKEGISSTLYLGVKRDGNEMLAHAWLRCGEYYVTGGTGEGYANVAKFSNENNLKDAL